MCVCVCRTCSVYDDLCEGRELLQELRETWSLYYKHTLYTHTHTPESEACKFGCYVWAGSSSRVLRQQV